MMFSSRMPPPPAGKRYQLWVIADRVRPVGAFSPESQSPFEVTSLMEFKTVWHPVGA